MRATALASALFLAGGVVPVAGGIAMMFAPAPILLHAIGLPRAFWRAVACVLLVAGFVALGAGPAAGVGYLVTMGLTTAIICYMLEHQKPFELVVLAVVAAVLMAGAFSAVAITGSPAALAATLHHEVAAGMARGEHFSRILGVQSGITAETRGDIVDLAVRLAPALIALSAAFAALMNLAVFWRWAGKQRLGYSLFGDLVRWSTPEWLIWVFLAAGFGIFIPFAPLSTIALDCFICVAAVYFCQGLAIMAFYFRLLKMPGLARGLIYFVTLVQPVLGALVCACGVFDMWIDFRRLKPPSREAGSFGDFF